MSEPLCDCCEMCGGLLIPLGVLGNLEHLRCRNCGAECSRERQTDETEIPEYEP